MLIFEVVTIDIVVRLPGIDELIGMDTDALDGDKVSVLNVLKVLKLIEEFETIDVVGFTNKDELVNTETYVLGDDKNSVFSVEYV